MVLFCLVCLALLVYFLIMAIFFPKYRSYVKEGWRCFLDKLRRKKCAVSFDNRMRMALAAWLTQRGMVRLGRLFSNKKNFDILLTSFIVITTILSIYLVILFIYFQFYPPCDTSSVCAVEV
jgi:hypothetical protein